MGADPIAHAPGFYGIGQTPGPERRTIPKKFDPWPRVFNLWNPRLGHGQVKNLPPRGTAHAVPNRSGCVPFSTPQKTKCLTVARGSAESRPGSGRTDAHVAPRFHRRSTGPLSRLEAAPEPPPRARRSQSRDLRHHTTRLPAWPHRADDRFRNQAYSGPSKCPRNIFINIRTFRHSCLPSAVTVSGGKKASRDVSVLACLRQKSGRTRTNSSRPSPRPKNRLFPRFGISQEIGP